MAPVPAPPLTLLDAVRREIRARHFSIRTEQQYVYWIRGFVRHFGRQHPRQMGAAEVRAYLSMLANERRGRPPRKTRRCRPCSFSTAPC
jgi:hypothetical protein